MLGRLLEHQERQASYRQGASTSHGAPEPQGAHSQQGERGDHVGQ